ncbi:unnamed protein product [Symbiodinium sp. CCMP2456]|nr:unnamed protein product [Symbiodinium sp. CCMP2456]
MKKNAEGVFDWKLVDGKLEYWYIMIFFTLRNALVGSGSSGDSNSSLALSISQMAALQNFVEVSAMNFWKKKRARELLEADADQDNEDDDEEFLDARRPKSWDQGQIDPIYCCGTAHLGCIRAGCTALKPKSSDPATLLWYGVCWHAGWIRNGVFV